MNFDVASKKRRTAARGAGPEGSVARRWRSAGDRVEVSWARPGGRCKSGKAESDRAPERFLHQPKCFDELFESKFNKKLIFLMPVWEFGIYLNILSMICRPINYSKPKVVS